MKGLCDLMNFFDAVERKSIRPFSISEQRPTFFNAAHVDEQLVGLM
jgi:hypothetical protein